MASFLTEAGNPNTMKLKEQRHIKAKLRELANKYHPALLNLEEVVFEVYEETKPELRAEAITKKILDSHLIGLNREQEVELQFFWDKALSAYLEENQ